MSIEAQILIIVLLIVLSAFFSASETALVSLSRFKVHYMIEKKRFGAAHIKMLKDNPEKLLTAILIGNNIVNISASVIATSIAIDVFKSNAIGIATGVMTFLILIFGEITPKALAIRNNEAFSLFAAPPVWWLSKALSPLVRLIEYFLSGLNRLIGTKEIPIITKEEIKSIVKSSEEKGAIKEIEKRMIQRIFDFDNTTVGDVMTRSKSIVSVSSDMHIKDVLHLPAAKIYSRFPVYEKSRDSIVGILHLKDMLKFIKDGRLDVGVRQIMKKPMFVFANKKIDAMLRMFQNRKQHMALVIDGKGHVVGLVTIENILEEIVGEIIDESDRINPSVTQISKNEWVAKGTSEIEEVNIKTGMLVKESDYDNLDSFIMATLGRIPTVGEEISYQNFKVIIEDMQGRKVVQARIARVQNRNL